MKRKNIILSLVHVQRLRVGGEPDQRWVADTRAVLLAQVAADRAPANRPFVRRLADLSSLLSFGNAPFAYQPILAVILVIAVVMGGSVSAVSAAMSSLPGDMLYEVKLAAERAQVAVAQNDTTKAELTVAFMGRRVAEVDKLVHDENTVDSPERVGVAVRHIKEDLGSVQASLTQLQSNNAPQEVVKIAKLIDEKSAEYGSALTRSVNDLPIRNQAPVKEARALVADLSVRAVIALVEIRDNGGTDMSDEELAKKVGDKIQSFTNEAAKVATQATSTDVLSSGQTATQALSALGTAQKFLDDNQFSSALSKVIEGKELVQAAQKIVDATNGTAALTAMSTSTSGATIGGGTATIGLPMTDDIAAPAPSALPSASEPKAGMTTGTTPSPGG